MSALHLAAKAGRLGVVQALLRAGATVSLLNKVNYTALHCALVGGHVEVARALQSAGAKVDQVVHDMGLQTFLYRVSCAGNLTQVLNALSLRAQPDLKNIQGSTALHCASGKGHVEVVSALLNHGGWKVVDTRTPQEIAGGLWGGYRYSQAEFVRDMLRARRGANPDLLDNNGRAPLHLAAWGGHLEVVHALQRARGGASPDLLDSNGHTPLHLAAWGGHSGLGWM